MWRSEARTERRRAWWLEPFVGRTALANDYVQANAQKVADIMTRNVVTATPETPLGEIAAMLERHHIKRVPIVRGGKVLGIVSRANLIQALASIRKKRSTATAPEDSAIPEDVLARLRNEPWIKLWSVNVIVPRFADGLPYSNFRGRPLDSVRGEKETFGCYCEF
jgi:CBS-domain-containing membrane protein